MTLLSYIMLGFWHIGHFAGCFVVGIVLSVAQFVMSVVSFLNKGWFKALNPLSHKVTIAMSVLIFVLYSLELCLD